MSPHGGPLAAGPGKAGGHSVFGVLDGLENAAVTALF